VLAAAFHCSSSSNNNSGGGDDDATLDLLIRKLNVVSVFL
jgi:hypothetical protein